MNNEEIPLAPVARWGIAPIATYGAVMLQLQYLTHATQQPEEAHRTPNLLLPADQCRELIQALERTLQRLESGPPQGTGLPKH